MNNLSIDQALPFLGADLQFTPDGSKLLEVGSAPFQKPVALYIYDIANGEPRKTVEILGDAPGPANEIYGEGFPFYISSNSHYLTTFYQSKAILVDLENSEVVAIAESEISEFGHQIGYVSDNGKSIILVQKSGKVVRASFVEGTPIQSAIKLSGDSWLLQYSSAIGMHYRIEKSQDLENWTLLENVREGNGEGQEFVVDNDKERSLFLRVLELL